MPATAVPDTGHGTTLTFGTTSWTGKIRKIGGFAKKKAKIETSYLATTGDKTFIAGDLADWDDVTATVLFETLTGLPALGSADETITLTFPIPTGGTTGGIVAGTGFITAVKYPEAMTGQLMEGEITFCWSGNTDVTFTAAT
jgi:hypothetical protein